MRGDRAMCILWMWLRESGTVDDKRDGCEDGWIPRSGAGAMEKFRRENDLGVLVQGASEVHRQAAGVGGDSWGTRGAVAANVSGTQQLFVERTGDRADLSECARVDGIWKDLLAAGQWL